MHLSPSKKASTSGRFCKLCGKEFQLPGEGWGSVEDPTEKNRLSRVVALISPRSWRLVSTIWISLQSSDCVQMDSSLVTFPLAIIFAKYSSLASLSVLGMHALKAPRFSRCWCRQSSPRTSSWTWTKPTFPASSLHGVAWVARLSPESKIRRKKFLAGLRLFPRAFRRWRRSHRLDLSHHH